MLAASAIVVAALAAVVTGSVWPRSTGTAAVSTQTAPSSPPTSPQAPPTSAEAAISEADLRGGALPSAEQTAAAHAAWFVADYLTADGSDVTAAAVAGRLPTGVSGPEQPAKVRSFVESATPIEVEDLGGGRLRVLVVARYLVAADGGEYRRPEAIAMEVVMVSTADGVAVADLPMPVPLPEPALVDAPPVEPGDIPAVVLQSARAQAASWGEPSEQATSVGRMGDVWRVELAVITADGLELPVAVWLDSEGDPVAAGG